MKHYKNRLKTYFTIFREWKISASRNGQDMCKLLKKILRSDFDTTVRFIVHYADNFANLHSAQYSGQYSSRDNCNS